MPQTLAILSLASLSGLATLIGVALAFCFRKSVRGIAAGIGFSTGIMLLISFLELIPESVRATGIERTIIAVILGVLLVTAFNFVVPHTHIIKEGGKLDSRFIKTAYLVAFGLILHDFPEGFAMANSYIHSPSLGVLMALAIAIHNIPEEFAMAVPLVLTKKKETLFKAAFISGLAEPMGALVGLFAVHLAPALNPLFMAFAAGVMIFISIHELLPMAAQRKKSLAVLGIILSGFVYWGLATMLPE